LRHAERNSSAPLRTVAALGVLLLVALSSPPSVLGGFITYYSGDDATISVGQCAVETRRFLERTPYVNFEERFSYAQDLPGWCSINGWAASGDIPSSEGSLSLALSPDGGICWHNWQRLLDGSAADCCLSHPVGPLGSTFELEAELHSSRSSPSAVPGSPALHVRILLYDAFDSLLFTEELVYSDDFDVALTRQHLSQLTTSINAASVRIRMWQNSSGAFITHDNGSSVHGLGTFATSPSLIELRFHSDEVNDVNGQSDYEYLVFIDRISLRSLAVDTIDFSGLQAGEWHLVSSNGDVLAQATSSHCTSLTVSASDAIEGFLSSIRSYTCSKSGIFLPNSLLAFDMEGGYFTLSEYGPAPFLLGGCTRSSDEWQCPSGKIGRFTYGGPYSTGTAVYATLASDVYVKSNAEPWLQKTVDLWASTLEVNATFGIEMGRGTLTHAQLSSIDLTLGNSSIIAINVQHALSAAAPTPLSLRFDLGEITPIRSVRFNFALEAYNYARISVEISDLIMSWHGYDGMIVKGLPDGGALQVYDGGGLVESLPCDGSDLKVSLSASLPRECRVEVVYSPSSRPVASYDSPLGWSDRLDLVDGELRRSNTGVGLINLSRASECDNSSGWSYRWNLATGGATPAFSTQAGFLIMRQDGLTGKGSLPTIEAYYWFDYPLNLTGSDFTVAVSADATFNFITNGILLSKYCEISLYAVSDGVSTLLADSPRSLTPQLLATVPFSNPETCTVDKLVVEVHAYARSSLYSILQSYSNIVRIDYLRINSSSMPEGYPNVLVAGLGPGQYVLCGGSKFWANQSGSATVPLEGSSWPSVQSLQVFDSSECYQGPFLPGGAYCPVEARVKSASGNRAFIMMSTPCYSYCEELTLVSISRGIDRSGICLTMELQYRVLDNGTISEPRKIDLYADGSRVNVIRNGFCCYTVHFNVYPNAESIRLAAVTDSGMTIRCTVAL
jgi:hypothetical protein